MRRPDPAADAAPVAPPSKTRRKQAMHELQDLGAELVELDPRIVAKLDLPERLADAIHEARGITKHEARRRQLQFVGRLMRDVDPAPIRAELARLAGVDHAERAHFAAAEGWRDRLLAHDEAVAAFAAAFAGVDAVELAALVRDARAERASGRPPHRFRALFRLIAKAIEPPPSPPSP
jgi:ribosome-associated protein